jgi:hypothetical protein
MKKIIILFMLGFAALQVNAQKENGTVYSEHESINKIKAMWAAFVKGDKEAYTSYFADTVFSVMNDNPTTLLKKDIGQQIDWWKGFENLTIEDNKPAFPDAINYKVGGLWVQDWMIWKATHKETGYNINLPVHSLYSFNDKGKIRSIIQYFDSHPFDEIYKNARTIQSGVVYNYHPFIVSVRKAVNAYCAEDLDKLSGFYTPDAVFGSTALKVNETVKLDEQKKAFKKFFDDNSSISLVQTGNPNCVCYDNEYYVVYSWWNLSYTSKTGVKVSGIPVLLSDSFNKEGKIISEMVYYSTNLYQ